MLSRKLFAELQAVAGQGLEDRGVERISLVLEEEGITTPAQFADLALQLAERERQSGAAAAIDPTMLDPGSIDERRPGGEVQLTHREPAAPFYINGLEMEPRDVRRFDGQPLHFALHGEHDEQQLIACERYSDLMHIARKHEMLALLRQEIAAQEAASRPTTTSPHGQELRTEETDPDLRYVTCPTLPRPPGTAAQFFEDINFRGDWFWLEPGYQYYRLSNVGGDWNDKISSVRAGDGRVVLWEHRDYRGSTFTVFGGKVRAIFQPGPGHPICGPYFSHYDVSRRQNVANLVPIGWNDRASSIQHFHQ